MFKLYAILIVVGLLGGAAYGAKYYYDTHQNTIASLRENNGKLEFAMKQTKRLSNRWVRTLQD